MNFRVKLVFIFIVFLLSFISVLAQYKMEIWVRTPNNVESNWTTCESREANFKCVYPFCCTRNSIAGDYYGNAKTFENNVLKSESGWKYLFNCEPPPEVVSVNPSSGLYYNSITLTFRTVYRDINSTVGAADIQTVYFAISPPNYGNQPNDDYEDANCESFEGNLSYYFGAVYYPSSRTFKVASIDTGGCPWANTDTNKLGTAKLLSVSHSISGTDLIVDWTIQFNNFDTGSKNLYLMAIDNRGQGNDNVYDPCGGAVWEKKGQITFYGIAPPTITTIPPKPQCYTDADCPCYANCVNGQCRDFRSLVSGCNYYDACQGNSNCCNNNICNPDYCYNVDEDICEDEYYVCHGFISNCGVTI